MKPLYDKKDEAKLVAQEAALAAPKLPVRLHKSANSMDLIAPEAAATATTTSSNNMGGSFALISFITRFMTENSLYQQ